LLSEIRNDFSPFLSTKPYDVSGKPYGAFSC
jgi:hypothetical protein